MRNLSGFQVDIYVMAYWDKISKEQIQSFLKSKGVEGEIEELHDTLGKQQVFRVKVSGKHDAKEREEIKSAILAKFTTKVPDVSFVNENFNFSYNKAHMLVYDVEQKYQNVYSAKVQMQIGEHIYGYEILFDDMKGIVEWNKEYDEIQKDHKEDGTSIEFKGLIDMFNLDLQNHVDIKKHVKKTDKPTKKQRKEQKKPRILINYDQSKGLISYICLKDLGLDNTAFNRLTSQFSSQGLYVTYDKRETEYSSPEEMYIGKNGSMLSDNDMVNITKVLDKNGIDTTDYEFVNVDNISLMPASALIRQTMLNQIKDL